MKNTDIAKIRQLLKEHCKWCLGINGCAAELCNITVALTLLPCETCNGSGKSLEYAKACPECDCAEYVNENLLGENYRECKKCGQDWWLQIKYAIGDSPCPDCQKKPIDK
jgi:hypothetical protein